MRRWSFLIPLLILALLLLLVGDASACPNCKGAVADQPEDAERLANGFNYSILFMMAMPFALLSTGAFMIVRAVKRGALPEM